MDSITKKIEIDLYSPTSYEVIIAQQGDNISRTIEFTLYNQGEPYNITEEEASNILAIIEGRRGDHSSFMKECELKDNVITAILDSNILYEAGTIQAKLFLYDSNANTILSTIPFLISVQKDPCAKNRIEAEKSSAFDWLILQFHKLKNSFLSHATDFSNPHKVTKEQVGLGNVPNVTTNNQTPEYEASENLSELSSGETLSSAFGKLSKAVSDFIVQKEKLDGIENGAEVNVQPDWAITDSESDAYIKNKPSIYTTAEIDNKFSSLETNIDWKESVSTYNEITSTYPNPQDGWTVNVQDTDYTYRYNGTAWIAISANAIPKATSSVDGLFSKEDYVKFESLYNGAVAGVKGNAESTYRTGHVNLTAANIGALPNTAEATINSAYGRANTAYNQANAAYNRANTAVDRINDANLYLGRNATVYGTYSVALGGYSYASGNYSTALGYSANASSHGSTAVGYIAQTNNYYSTAIGYGANAALNSSTALGSNANASGISSIAIGPNAVANSNYSVVIGTYSNACGGNSIALGNFVSTNGLSAIAIGYHANIKGNGSLALGYFANVQSNYSNAIGYCANVYSDRSVALGYYANVSNISTNTIQLGNASTLSTLSCRVDLSVTSDERDKTDITEMEDGALEFLNKIHAIRYVLNHRELYIDDENLSEEEKEKKEKYGLCEYDRESHANGTKKGTRVRAGVSAQEVQIALKEVYGDSSYANLINDNLFDLNPEDIPDGVENQLTANYTGFIPFLIKAIQELSRDNRNLSKELKKVKELIKIEQ